MSRLANVLSATRNRAKKLPSQHTASRTGSRTVPQRRIEQEYPIALLLWPTHEEAVRPDDVLVVVGRVEPRHRVAAGDRAPVPSAAADQHHLLVERVVVIEEVLVVLLPAVQHRDRLDVLGGEQIMERRQVD